jgi:transcriptional regulator GlxA family with amidase domain
MTARHPSSKIATRTLMSATRLPPTLAGTAQPLAFMLVPNFSMIAFAASLEPLRLANRVMGKQVYEWRLYSTNGRPVAASNGVEMAVTGKYSQVRSVAAAFVCSGLDVHAFDHATLITNLRRLVSHGTALGAVCTGAYVLALGGLLDGYRATIHWENRSGLMAEFPQLDVTEELFEIDRNRYTCAGGTAAIDMMLSMIGRDHGSAVAAEVSDTLIHHRIREAGESQRMNLRARLGIAHPKLLAVVARMESTLEHPLSCVDLADEVGLSTRQLERLFAKYLGYTPSRHYLNLRLERARHLLRQTSQPILAVALGTGFVSASHFSKSYHEYFGHAPSDERKSSLAESVTASTARRDPARPADRRSQRRIAFT